MAGLGYFEYFQFCEDIGALMVGMSLAGLAINPRTLHYDAGQFKVAPGTLALIVVTLLLIMALHVKFW